MVIKTGLGCFLQLSLRGILQGGSHGMKGWDLGLNPRGASTRAQKRLTFERIVGFFRSPKRLKVSYSAPECLGVVGLGCKTCRVQGDACPEAS